jgi:hypothetical protein
MLGSYFKIAQQVMFRNKMTTVICTPRPGMASCLLLTLFVLYQAYSDPIHKTVSRMVRFYIESAADEVPTKASISASRVFPDFKKDFSEVGLTG